MKNLVAPEEIFNLLGKQEFGEEWTERPLQILQGVKKKPKPASKAFLRNKFIADEIYKKFVRFMNGENVTIYVQRKQGDEPEIWDGVRCSLERKHLLLIDQEIHPEHGPMDVDFMRFWIEMPKDKNLIVFKKAGTKPTHDKGYLKSILPEVLKLVPDKVTERSLANAYSDYLKGQSIDAPSKSWIGKNLDTELKKIREQQ